MPYIASAFVHNVFVHLIVSMSFILSIYFAFDSDFDTNKTKQHLKAITEIMMSIEFDMM